MPHTDGPWEANARLSGSENHKGYYIKCRRFVLADVTPVDSDGVEGGANASLIAAAPDLLEACKVASALLHGLPRSLGYHIDARQLDAAIAKATGESK